MSSVSDKWAYSLVSSAVTRKKVHAKYVLVHVDTSSDYNYILYYTSIFIKYLYTAYKYPFPFLLRVRRDV